MPRQVDHQQRREEIAAALMRVAASQGLEAVSLRHVAAEAGVTAGMVQHYFATKDAMMEFAMASASARYEARMTQAVSGLGEDPPVRDLLGTMLRALLPLDEAERADGRVVLAFLSYAATRRAAATDLVENDAGMREFVTEQIRSAQSAGEVAGEIDPRRAATALFATAEGLAIHVLTGGLPADDARAALDAQLDLTLGPPRS